jgi:hypothetical protein
MFREQGVDIQNNYQSTSVAAVPRPEMIDIDHLLSGLKQKRFI